MLLLRSLTLAQPRLQAQLRPQNPRVWSRHLSGSEAYPGWRVRERRTIAEFDISAVLLEHEKTRARYLHMDCQDENKAFSVNFRTTPMDSTGVAHILEHTTLCGSNKYPVRDPFMKMLNRSLSTFMNAMTGPDYTLYPFSTCNSQDYHNLMSVYLDSVFRPLLREQDFLQEGWRLEHDELADTETPLVVKGVVFNEMKGAYANSQSLFGQSLLNNLYPSHTYSHSSGGFPLNIPQLTWENLKQFHSTHYHPSNARILSYGNIDLARTLSFLDSEYLSKFEEISANTSVPSEPRWSAPRKVDITCAADPINPDPVKQSTIAVSFLLTDITDLKLSFALQVTAELLTGGPSSPFYQALIEPGYGSNFSPVSGYEDHTRDTNFTISLQNIDIKDSDKIQQVINETIDKVVQEGFDSERIEAVLHSYELSLKHKSANFGVNLIMSLTPFWNHADNPLDYLEVNETIEWFKSELKKDPEFLQNIVKTHLKANPHKLVQTMSPVENYNELEQTQFDQLEEDLRRGLSEEDKSDIHAKCLELQELQTVKEDISCLPTIQVSDISSEYSPTSLESLTLSSSPVLVASQPTNEVTYWRALIDTSSLPEDLKTFLPIFSSVLTKMGAGRLGYAELDTAVELRTGGLAALCHLAMEPGDTRSHSEGLVLSSHCLDRNLEHMFHLWQLVFSEVHWDNTARLGQLVKMIASETSNGVAQSGHRYAMTSAASCLTAAARRLEQTGGMSHVKLLGELSQQDLTPVVNKLRTIAGEILNKNRMKCVLHSSNTELAVRETEKFLGSISGQFSESDRGCDVRDFRPSVEHQHYVTPFPINFTSQAVPTVSYTHPDYAPLRVLTALLSSKFLHPEIREKGGAYGGGASASDGCLTFYSYRDPRNLETFSVYERSASWLLEDNFHQGDVNEAILRVFQGLDAPVTPGYRGMREFLTGVTEQMFADHRLAVKAVRVADIKTVAEKYLVDPPVYGKTMIGGLHPGLEDLGWTVHKQ